MRPTLPTHLLSALAPGCFLENEVCSASTRPSCALGACRGEAGAQEAHREAAGPAWVAQPGVPAAVLPLPVSFSGAANSSESPLSSTAPSLPPPEPPELTGPCAQARPVSLSASRRARRAARAASAAREEPCARGVRSFVDVLECLM